MLDELKQYLTTIRLKLESLNRDDIPIDMLMDEVSEIATSNWVNLGKPNLTENQLNKVITRVIAKRYNNN